MVRVVTKSKTTKQCAVRELVSKQDVLDYKDTFDARLAADLLLMYGPDGFDGTFKQYTDLLEDLEEEALYDKV